MYEIRLICSRDETVHKYFVLMQIYDLYLAKRSRNHLKFYVETLYMLMDTKTEISV
jgi:hypothetical protein